jgi:metal-responsive CopG/Arc/MetJ family transcriptional regulator
MMLKNVARAQTQRTSLVRASISFPPNLYEMLEKVAKEKRVSLAWVVRDAGVKCVASEVKQGRKGGHL